MRRLLAIAAVPLALACASPIGGAWSPVGKAWSPVGEPFTIEDWAHKPIGRYAAYASWEVAWKVTITNHTSEPLRCSVYYTWLDEDDFPLSEALSHGTIPANSTADIGSQWPISEYKFEGIAGASATANCH